MTTTTTTASTDGTAEQQKVHDPIHHVAYSFEQGDGHIWVHTWFEDGGTCPSTSIPPSRSTGRSSRAQHA